jgi:hypothetical protein
MSLPPDPYWSRIDATRQAVMEPDLAKAAAFWGDRLPRLAEVVATVWG